MRALGVSSTTRVPSLPDVPTIAEAGVTGFDAVGWTLISCAAATPHRSSTGLHAELKTVAATPDDSGADVRLGTPPGRTARRRRELQKFLGSEIDRWGGIIERAGVAKSQ